MKEMQNKMSCQPGNLFYFLIVSIVTTYTVVRMKKVLGKVKF